MSGYFFLDSPRPLARTPCAMEALTAAHLSSPSPSSLTAVAEHVIRGDHAALQQLVGALGPQLTSTDERERSQATLLLSDVLSRMTLSALPADSVAHLADFFCNRLTDYPCAAAVMRGLLALLSSPLQAEHALRIGTTLLEECDVRSLVQAERHAALTLANELVRAHWAALSSSGVRMLLSALRGLDGEKDPRNLLLYLQLLRTLCQRCEEQRAPGFDVTANQRGNRCSALFLDCNPVHRRLQPYVSRWPRRRSSRLWRSTSPSPSRLRPTTRTASPSSTCCRRCCARCAPRATSDHPR